MSITIKKMEDIFEKYNMLEKDSNIIVGVSGGADSICLLHILYLVKNIYKVNIIPVHINHGFRGIESDLDEQFVVNFCNKIGLKCAVYRCNLKELSKKMKISEEEAGRFFRYQSFRAEFLKNQVNKICVAHTKNDQCETILMRIIRGSGIKGTSGMNHINGDIIRPLLAFKREEIELYCKNLDLKFQTDSTNFETIYTRNKIRLELIPYIENNFNKKFIDSLYNFGIESLESENYLQKKTTEIYDKIVTLDEKNIIVNLKLFNDLDIVFKKRIIRQCYEMFSNSLVDFTKSHVDKILEIEKGETGKKISLPSGVFVRKNYDELIFFTNTKKKSSFFYDIPLEKIVFIKEKNFYVTISKNKINYIENKINTYTNVFSCDKIIDSFAIRSKISSDKIFLNHINGSKKIKNYFIDEKIDVLKRDEIPLLAVGSEVLWIMDKNNLKSDKFKDKKIKFIVQIWEDING